MERPAKNRRLAHLAPNPVGDRAVAGQEPVDPIGTAATLLGIRVIEGDAKRSGCNQLVPESGHQGMAGAGPGAVGQNQGVP